MFLNENTLSKTAIHLDESEQAFWLDGERIAFDDVEQFYQHFTEHYTNSVYQGKVLQVKLAFHSERPPFKASVDTRHIADYARLYQVAHHLVFYRLQRFKNAHQQGETLAFPVRYGRYTLELKGVALTLRDNHKQDDPVEGCWPVTQAIKQKTDLLLKGPKSQKKRFNLRNISDVTAFFCVIERQSWFVNADQQCQKREARFILISFLLLTVFALNGWFELCYMDSLWIEVPSVLAKILFPVVSISIVLQLLWLKPSESKQKQGEAETEDQALAGELPAAPQLRWYTRWAWLLWFLGGQGLIVLMAIIIQALRG